MKKLILAICLSLLSALAFCQWTWQNPKPQGNDLKSVKFATPDVGYTVGTVGTIMKTTDGGVTWTHLISGINTDLTSFC